LHMPLRGESRTSISASAPRTSLPRPWIWRQPRLAEVPWAHFAGAAVPAALAAAAASRAAGAARATLA
ncbi:unnamed protein product, partial [Prorocentrum cordatum]